MPVHMAVRLLAPEAEHVKALRRHRLSDRLSDAIHDSLEIEIVVEREVSRHLLAMLFRRDQDVAVEGRIPVQKRDGGIVFVDHGVLVLGISGEHLAYEAASAQSFADLSEIDMLRLEHT